MDWIEVARRIGAGEDVEAVLDEFHAAQREQFRSFLADEGPKGVAALAKFDQQMRDLDSGVDGARRTWQSLSPAQRDAVCLMVRDGTRLQRNGETGFYTYVGHPGGFAIKGPRIATVRNLAARDLVAWDGGAFDPEAVAVLTERGRFVHQHGPGR